MSPSIRRLACALLPALLAGCAAAPHGPALEELLGSCSVEITALVDAEQAWAGALLEPHLLHEARAPRDLVAAGRPVRARAILLPVPRAEWPAHVLVREEGGIAVFTKYAPERLATVLLDPAYPLGDSFAVAELRRLAAPLSAQTEDVRDLDGEWIYVEDRTEGRSLEQMGPPMSSKFSLRVEEGAIVLNGHGSGHRDVRVALDGAITEIKEAKTISRYHGTWESGTFAYEVAFERLDGNEAGRIRMIRRTFSPTAEGLVVSVEVDPPAQASVALYRHAEDIPMPAPEPAAIGDLAWLAGDWVGTKSTGSSIEERWSPPLGGAMLATSRSVNASGKMFAFEYLRIVERDGGLVYVAQPGGGSPTEFVLSELSAQRAVFDNPRHDYPKRIVYELSAEGALSATTGLLKGGTPRRFDFQREHR